MATRTDCVIYLNWYEFLKTVADGAGITIPSSLVAQISQARGYFEAGRYAEAYSMSSAAVRDFRALLKAQKDQLTARCTALIDSINVTRSSAISKGIDVSAFTTPFNSALAMYDGSDFIGSFYALSGLSEDLSSYVSNARLGKYVLPMSGTYNIPTGTTDVIILNACQVETAGWAYLSPEEIRAALLPIVKESGVEDILEIRVSGPRIIIFCKGSPFAWIPFIALLLKAIMTIIIAVVLIWRISAYFIEPAVQREKEAGDLARAKVEAQTEYDEYIADKVASGEISPEVGSEMTKEHADNMSTIQLPSGWGITDYIKLGIGIAIIGGVLYFTIPVVRSAFEKKGKKKKEKE